MPHLSLPLGGRPRSLAVASLALAVGLGLSACVPSQDDEGASDDRISLAMVLPPRSGLSPFSDDAFKLSRWRTAETLVSLDADGQARPMLATQWEQTAPRTWTFQVRDGVTFHDGTTLDADAVVTALTAAAAASPLPRILDGVELDVSTPAPGVVEVSTATPDPLLPQRLSSPQLAVLAPTAYDGGAVDPVGTGTGPFALQESNGAAGATLDRYDDYWGEPAQVSGIDVSYVPDGTARAAALRTGDADIVEAVPVSQAAQVDADLVHEVPMPRTNTLYLNTTSGPFSDPAVRAAARDAVDRARLVSDVYEGRADIAKGLLGPALPWAAGLRDSADYQALLEQTAPASADRVDGVPITLGTFTDRAELPEVAVLLEQSLEDAGFEVTQEVREYQFIEADALEGAFDAFILSRATVLDSGDPVAYLVSDFSCAGSFNIAQLCDPEVDRLLQVAAATPAGERRQRAIMRAEAAVLALDAAVPLLHERVIQGESADVTGVARDPRERDLVQTSTRLER